MQTPVSRPAFIVSGFIGAALSAPGLAVVICMLGAIATALFAEGDPTLLGAAVFGVILFFLLATLWGAIPSLVFGGLVLAVMQRIPWRRPPAALEFTAGGVVAAGLYVLTAIGVAGLAPGAALVFAPWTAPDLMGGDAGAPWWVVTSLLLAGAGAGRFYAMCVKRG
ncbi:MAG: hypothetical protein ACXW3K_06655 [Brevundimonas sp.]